MMTVKLTDEEIKNRIESAFKPHHLVVKFSDYSVRLSFQVQSKKDNTLLYTQQPELLTSDWRSESDLVGIIAAVGEQIARAESTKANNER